VTGTEGKEKGGAPRKGLCACVWYVVCVRRVSEWLQKEKARSLWLASTRQEEAGKGRLLGWGGRRAQSPAAPPTQNRSGQHHVLKKLTGRITGVRVQGLGEGGAFVFFRPRSRGWAQSNSTSGGAGLARLLSPALSPVAPPQPPPSVYVCVVVCGDAGV
jgi:hypothetical protein